MTEFRVEVVQIGEVRKHPNADTLREGFLLKSAKQSEKHPTEVPV